MSYDLYFRARSKDTELSREDFTGYFGARQRYQVKDLQAWYTNEDSGVYFSFEYRDAADGAPDDETDPSLSPVAFNLNFFRPHAFALEAEPEVSAFVRAFGLTVSDPQLSGMGEGDYSREGFLSGWNTGNAFGYRAVTSQNPDRKFPTLPAAQVEALWRWNFERDTQQHALGDAAFVPRICFFEVDGRIKTAVIWPDGIPILLPVVDLILAARQRLAPRGWFRTKDDLVLLSWQQIAPIAQRFGKGTGAMECLELFYDATPGDIEKTIRDARPRGDLPTSVTFDHVLDRELFEQAPDS